MTKALRSPATLFFNKCPVKWRYNHWYFIFHSCCLFRVLKKAQSYFKTKLIFIWILCRAIAWNDKRISHSGNDMLPCFYLWRRWLKLPRTQSAWERPAERLAAGEGTDEMRHWVQMWVRLRDSAQKKWVRHLQQEWHPCAVSRVSGPRYQTARCHEMYDSRLWFTAGL